MNFLCAQANAHKFVGFLVRSSCVSMSRVSDGAAIGARWGVWQEPLLEQGVAYESSTRCHTGTQHVVHLCVAGEEVQGCFGSREAAQEFQASQLSLCDKWCLEDDFPPPSWSALLDFYWTRPEVSCGRTVLSGRIFNKYQTLIFCVLENIDRLRKLKKNALNRSQ